MRLGKLFGAIVWALASGCGAAGPAPASSNPPPPGATAAAASSSPGDVAPGAAAPEKLQLSTLTRQSPAQPLAADRVKTTWQVKPAAATVLIEGAAAAALTSSDPQSHTYRFDAAKLSAAGLTLAPGKVMLLAGTALRKVRSVRQEGGALVVETDYAALTDAIEEGHFGFDAKLAFDKAHAVSVVDQYGGEHALVSARSALGSPGVIPEGAIPWSFQQGPMTYEFEVKPDGDAVTIKIKAIKKQGPKANLAYTALGTFRNVQGKLDGTIKQQKLSTLDYEQAELEGDITLSVAAAGSGLGKIEFPFPGVMFKFLVMVGPVPVTLGVGAKIIGSIQVPASASATAKSQFELRSSSGFTYKGSDVDVKGNIGDLKFTPTPFDSASSIGIPVDAQWGVAFPRLSVSVFDSLFVPYMHTGVVVGTALKWGPICKFGYVKYTSEVGYDFKIFGVSIKKDKVIIAEREQKAPKAGCPKNK